MHSHYRGSGSWSRAIGLAGTPCCAVDVLSAALDVLLVAMTSGMFAKSQIGKFITVYPSDDAQAVRLAVDLECGTGGGDPWCICTRSR